MKTNSLTENLRQMGFAPNRKVRAYGRDFDVISNPIVLPNVVLIDAVDCQTGDMQRVRIPECVVKEATQSPSRKPSRRSTRASEILRSPRRGELDQRGINQRFRAADEEDY